MLNISRISMELYSTKFVKISFNAVRDPREFRKNFFIQIVRSIYLNFVKGKKNFNGKYKYDSIRERAISSGSEDSVCAIPK